MKEISTETDLLVTKLVKLLTELAGAAVRLYIPSYGWDHVSGLRWEAVHRQEGGAEPMRRRPGGVIDKATEAADRVRGVQHWLFRGL